MLMFIFNCPVSHSTFLHSHYSIALNIPPLSSSLRLAKTIELEGGVSKIIITHSDDIQDHDKWKARFPEAQRIMHR
jgi:hypothetical protein